MTGNNSNGFSAHLICMLKKEFLEVLLPTLLYIPDGELGILSYESFTKVGRVHKRGLRGRSVF